MKTKLLFTILLSFAFCILSSQVPQGFNYQAIARDGGGAVLPNTPLQVMFYVQSLSTGGTLYWKEWYSSVTTNSFGLFTLVVGNGIRQTESTVATFDAIDWTVTSKFLKTEIYYSSAWHDLGTSQLLTVPYAMVAEDLAGSVKKLSVEGETSGLEDALFEVKNKDGQTVFAVYNEGVRVYVSNGAKALKGGFAVGGFGTDKAESTKYLFVGKDSVRIYLDTNPLTKGKKSGFAVGGYDLTKGAVQNYLDVSADSVRIYVDSDPLTKKVKGGFAVGGYDMTKGVTTKYLNITPDSTRIFVADTVKGFAISQGIDKSDVMTINRQNTSIGHESGMALNPTIYPNGIYNTFLGYQSGKNNTWGRSNNFLGYMAGYSNNGDCNIFIGKESGKNSSTGGYNIFMGNQAGFFNNDGTFNIFMGWRSGYNNVGGDGNVCIGFLSGFGNTNGDNNVFIGIGSGQKNTTASTNLFLGYYAGSNVTTGYNNTYVGARAGMNCYTGHNNVYIGYMAGFHETNNNRLYIANNSGDMLPPLIYGNFEKLQVVIAGDSTDNPNDYRFFVNGSAGGTTSWNVYSDERLKMDIHSIANPLEKVLALRGVNFYWKDKSKMGDDLQIGFVAQEANEIVPEVVGKNGDYFSMQYAPITALIVEGMKEQQKQIEFYKSQLQSLQEKVDKIETLLAKALDE
jgi:hypothetical protein